MINLDTYPFPYPHYKRLIIYLPFRPWSLIPLVFLISYGAIPIFILILIITVLLFLSALTSFFHSSFGPFLCYRAIQIISLRPLVRIFGPSLNLTSFGPYILWPIHPLARKSFGPYILWTLMPFDPLNLLILTRFGLKSF